MNNPTAAQMQNIISAVSAVRTPAMPGEYDIHGRIASALLEGGIGFEHEYKLGPRCRVDFRAGRIGIEVKKGRPASSDLVKQLERYLSSDELDGMIVVVQRTVRIPDRIHGKPVYLLSLNRLWGVALP